MGATTANPHLLALYSSGDQPTRLAILTAFGSIGGDALPALETALTDRDSAIRAAAVRAWGRAQKNPDTMVATLIPLLDDSDSAVRRAVMDSLSPLGDKLIDKAIPALPALIRLTANQNESAYALQTLRNLQVRDIYAITFALDSPVMETRIWACERAGRIGRRGAPLKTKLEQLFNAGNDDRRAARRALEAINK